MAAKELGPASLRVAQAVAASLADSPGSCVVGVSGGADSLALAAGVAWAARREALAPLAVVVDHQLQKDSAEIAKRAAAQCRELGLETQIVPVAVGNEGGLEAAARDARRLALAAAGPGPILLGHTCDDQAESVLLGLARGSGGRSLAGMRAVTGRYRRPLLGLRRAVTEAACAEWGLVPWHDPMNADSRFLRVRARHAIAQLDQSFVSGVTEALARSAGLIADDVDYLDTLVAELPCHEQLEVGALADLARPLRTRLIRRWLLAAGLDGPTAHDIGRVEELVTQWHGQGPLDLAGIQVTRRGGFLIVQQVSR